MPVAEYELYKRIKLLGEGSFGKAYLVECVSDGALCVIKQVDLSKMSEQEKKDTLKEAKILEALRHPNIVRFREVYKTKKGKLCIVMDFADGGDLANKVKERRGQHLSEAQILDWFTQICLALKHVHDRKIIHRDLKGQNIFLTKSNIIKLGDFGIARVLTNTRDNARTMVGTPYYISPEIIENKPYSFKTDMWSLGVILYELCALKPPFTGDSLHFLALKIVRGAYNPIPSHFSKEMKSLLGSLLQTDPHKRPTTASILAMPFIQARIKNFLSESIRVNEFAHTILHKQKINLNEMKMEDLKNVLNEVPMPDHLVQQMKLQQQKENGKVQQQNETPPQQKENIQQLPQPSKENSNQNNLQKPPIPQHKPASNPVDQKQQIVQNIMAKKEEEKQAQQQVVKQNYHFKNQPQQQPQPQQQQAQQQPLSNRKPSADARPSTEAGGRRSDQPNKQQVVENPGPKIVSHQAEAQPKEFKGGVQKEADNRNHLQNQKKLDQNANLNLNKWEKKPLPEQQQHVQQKVQQQQYDPLADGKKDAFKKPPVDPKMKPQVEQPKKVVDREIIGAGGGGAIGGFANPNFAPNRNRKDSRDAPRKRNESAERQNNPPLKQNVSSERKGAPQLAKEINQKNEAALQKIAEANQKKQKEDEIKKQKEEDERLAKQADAEQKRIEKEKQREAQRQQMQMDIQKKRNMMKQGGGDFKVEFVGAKLSHDDSGPNLHSERSEETADTQQGDDRRGARDQVVSKQGSRNRNETPKQQKRGKWNVENQSNQASEQKKENKRIVYEDSDSNPNDKIKVEIYVPRSSRDRNVGAVEDDPKEKKNVQPRNNAWSAKDQKNNHKSEEVKDDDRSPSANKKEEEEFFNYAALLKELNDIVNEPENLQNNGSDSLGKNDPNVILENEEDRDDDFDDESSKGGSKDSPLLKKDKKSDDKGSNGKEEETPGDDNLDFISDYQKLESLKIFMEDSLGDEVFMKAYRITKDLFNKNANLEEIEQKYAKEDSYASLYPFIPSELRRKYLPLMFTFVIMEDIAEESMIKASEGHK